MKKLLCILEHPMSLRAFAASERELIDYAEFQSDMAGGPALFERAGIEELSCYHPETDETETWLAREWKEGEERATALEVFRENGTFLVFDTTSHENRQRFVLEAEARGCGEQARACLEEVSA